MSDQQEFTKKNLQKKILLLPEESGVYLHKNKKGTVLYVGKAKNLKNRVRSYFQSSSIVSVRIQELMKHVTDTQWIVTLSEAEALILEDQLIKLHKPKYNVQLRDDKSYPYLKLSIQELFPRLSLTREEHEKGAIYFGPYVSVHDARIAIKIIHKYFPLRQSSMMLDGNKTYRPCLNYQMQRCYAPCAQKISPKEYQELVTAVLSLLQGNHRDLLAKLEKKMLQKSDVMKFEEAANIRDQIQAVKRSLQKQKIVSNRKVNIDAFAIVKKEGFAGVQVIFIRNGIFLSHDFIFLKERGDVEDSEILRSVFSQIYLSHSSILPDEIISPIAYEEQTMVESYMEERRQKKVKIFYGNRGERRKILEMAKKNGSHHLELHLRKKENHTFLLEQVQQKLNLHSTPYRVECFDISNTSGTNSVASMVVWENNQPCKKDYRKYKIKTVEGPDDFASMKEVLLRRYKKVTSNENMPLPNLIIIDGGKGQLSSACSILLDLPISKKDFDIIGFAKGKSEKRSGMDQGDQDYEYVVKPNQKNEIRLKKNSPVLYFLQNIRDEAHRFAITYHRKLRSKTSTHSILEEINGIGPMKRKQLLQTFGSIQNIQQADLSTLKQIHGITKKNAIKIFKFFHP